MARVHRCVVLARQLAAAALRACSHMADGESAKRIEGEASPRRARQGRVRWTDGRLCRCGSRPLTVALWLDSQRKQRPASLRSEDHAEARMAQMRFDSRTRARVNTFRALTYKLLVLAAEHVDRSRRMSMRQGLQALFSYLQFRCEPAGHGLDRRLYGDAVPIGCRTDPNFFSVYWRRPSQGAHRGPLRGPLPSPNPTGRGKLVR